METALDDVATTRDHISFNPDMNNNNAFKDDERYPMNQTMSDDKAMQLKIGKEFGVRSLFRQFDIPTVRYSDSSIFRQFDIPTGDFDYVIVQSLGKYINNTRDACT